MSDSDEWGIDKLKDQKLQTDNIFRPKNSENIYNKKSSIKYNSNEDKKKINYNFNIFEIIFAFFCKCCLCKKLKLKNIINEKASDFLNINLDIVSYIRNQILFDIINETILDEQVKSIVNFLCLPVLSINHDIKNNFSDFYKLYDEKDFTKFSEELIELIQKPNKSIREKKLIKLSNNRLKYFF